MKPLSRLDYIKLIKYTIGAIVSILIANLLHLEYAMSTGIVTLLTIQDTKKETIKVSVKRITIFFIMTLLSYVVYPTLGYTVWTFGIVLIPYLFLCLLFDMKEAIAPIAVLCTHYISSKSCSPDMIENEFLILVIGASVGIIINLFMTDNIKQIKKRQREIDDSMRRILERMSIYIVKERKEDYTGSCFTELDTLLEDLKRESLQYMNNHFIGTNDYYYNYVQMRLSQCKLLKRIYHDIMRMEYIPTQATILSEVLIKISTEFHERNDAIELLEYINAILLNLRNEALPVTRQEFENRAILYHVLTDLEVFISLKKTFILQQ